MLTSVSFFSKSLALQKGVSIGLVYRTVKILYVQKSMPFLAFATKVTYFSIALLILRPSKQILIVLGGLVTYYAASFAYKLPAISAT